MHTYIDTSMHTYTHTLQAAIYSTLTENVRLPCRGPELNIYIYFRLFE